MATKVTPEIRDRIGNLWRRGKNASEIAQEVGVSSDVATRHRPLSVRVKKHKESMARRFKERDPFALLGG